MANSDKFWASHVRSATPAVRPIVSEICNLFNLTQVIPPNHVWRQRHTDKATPQLSPTHPHFVRPSLQNPLTQSIPCHSLSFLLSRLRETTLTWQDQQRLLKYRLYYLYSCFWIRKENVVYGNGNTCKFE